MVVVIEQGNPGEGSVQVAWAHTLLAGIYGVGSVYLARLLYRAIRANEHYAAPGISVVLAVLLALMLFHLLTGRAARRRRRWALWATRVVAYFLFFVFPIGTALAVWMVWNTRADRWAPLPGQPEKSIA